MEAPPIAFSEAQIMAWISPIFWPFLRVLAVFTSAPVFSAKAVPVRTKVGLAFVVALCLQPLLANQPLVPLNSSAALGAVLQQVLVGLAIGLAVRIVFSAIEVAGEVVGLQMGLNFAGFFDPTTNSQTSPIGRFFGNMSMLLFVVLNGHLLLIQAVAASFDAFPLGAYPLDAIRSMRLHELGALVFRYGLWIALPMIGMLMFLNLVMGIISRIAPQMSIFSIGFPMMLSVGLIGITATLPLMDRPVMALLQIVSDMFIGGG